MAELHSVAIFWDYENCHPGPRVSGYEVVNAIRNLALRYGAIKQFKAYFEVGERTISKPCDLPSELQSSGVSLTHCPHNGRKELADKMIIVDMMAFALDYQAPATAILISGDHDFAYVVSVLRNHRFRVIVIAPTNVHASLKSQASAILDWNDDVLEKSIFEPLDIGSKTSPQSTHSERHVRRGSQPTPFLQSQFSSKAISRQPINHFGTQARNCASSCSQNTLSDANPDRVDVKASDASWPPILGINAEWTAADDVTRLTDPSSVIWVGGNGQPFNNDGDIDWKLQRPPTESYSKNGISDGNAITTDASAWKGLIKPNPISRPVVAGEKRPSATQPTNLSNIPNERRAMRKSSTLSSFSPGISSSSLQLGSEESNAISLHSQPLHRRLSMTGPSPILVKAPAIWTESSGFAPFLPSESPVDNLSDDSQLPRNTPLPRSAEVSPRTEDMQEHKKDDRNIVNNSVPIPDFLPLVEQLARLRLAGNQRPLRSIVGQALVTRNPSIYKDVGVTGFSQYAALAQQSGIVELGGIGGKAWIFLKADAA